MSSPWYTLMWIPGTLFGIALGILGSFIGVQASRRKLRSNALRLMIVMVIVSAVFIVVGLAALFLGQHQWVWYGFLWPGLIGLVALGVNLPAVRKRVQEQTVAGS